MIILDYNPRVRKMLISLPQACEIYLLKMIEFVCIVFVTIKLFHRKKFNLFQHEIEEL